METVKISRLLVALALGSSAALVATARAEAKGCAPSGGGSPAVQQYVEHLPTSCGSTPSGSGNGHTKLPSSIQQKVNSEGGSDAQLLTQVATSKKFGAPQGKIRAPHKPAKGTSAKGRSNSGAEPTLKAAPKRNPFVASVSVATDGSNGRLIALLVMMAGVLALVLSAALYRRRSTR